MAKFKIKPVISVCLAVHNEAANLGRCLRSVYGLADEIIVVDGESQDRTVLIAKQYKAKVFSTTHKSMFHLNKQMAIDKAKGDWVLLLDADEEVTPGLRQEIDEVLQPKAKSYKLIASGYWIPRKNIIFGKWIKHTGWWPDYQLRLFKRGVVKFPCLSVHEHPHIEGETAKLSAPLIHHHYQSINQYLQRLIRYTDNDAGVLQKDNKQVQWTDVLIWPADEFIKRFIVWEGYKDGLHGLTLSLLQAFYRLVVWTKLWEKNQFTPMENQELDTQTRKIITGKIKEYDWWRKEQKIKQTANPVNRWIAKILRKIHL